MRVHHIKAQNRNTLLLDEAIVKLTIGTPHLRCDRFKLATTTVKTHLSSRRRQPQLCAHQLIGSLIEDFQESRARRYSFSARTLEGHKPPKVQVPRN